MPDLDTGRLVRLRASIQGSLATDAGPTSGGALKEAESRAYASIVAILPDDLKEEFESIFRPPGSSSWGRDDDLIAASAGAHRSRERLHAMAGWLDGLIETSQRRDARG